MSIKESRPTRPSQSGLMRSPSSLVLAPRLAMSNSVDFLSRITIPAFLPSRSRKVDESHNASRMESEPTIHSTPARNDIRLLNRKRSHHQRDAHLENHRPATPRLPNAVLKDSYESFQHDGDLKHANLPYLGIRLLHYLFFYINSTSLVIMQNVIHNSDSASSQLHVQSLLALKEFCQV